VDGLSVSFTTAGSRLTVVKDVSFSIRPGTVLALVGESGSGKSVTSRSLIGLAGAGARVEARTLKVAGRDALGLSEKQWRGVRGKDVGFVLQDALASLDHLRRVGAEVEEPLRLHSGLTRAQRAERVLELLGRAGIPDPASRVRQYPHQLSGGLRQRALIASAIANTPRVLIADEPTTALDATVAAQILRLLGGLVGEEGALLMVSHDLAAVASIADRIAVMNDGRIVEEGPAEAVLQDPQDPYTKRLLAAVPSLASRGRRLSDEPPAASGWAASAWVAAGTPAPGAAEGSATATPRAEGGHAASGIEAAGDAAGAALLELRGVSKSFRGFDSVTRPVLRDVSLRLHRGETLGVVGESGSGKTTAARIALGVEAADEGLALVGGVPWADVPRAERERVRRGVQLISQDPLGSFDPRYTVGKVLAEPLAAVGVRGAAARLRAAELLDLVRLPVSTLERRSLQLSGGQRQRVAIARALAVAPSVIVADEPVSALDVSVQAQILDLFADVRREYGVASLFISHDLGVINHVSDRVMVLSGGEVVESGGAEDVLRHPQHPYTRELLAAIPRLDARRGAGEPEGRIS